MRSRWLGTSVAVAGLVVGLAACPDDEAERRTATLPPILTTTSTTTIPPPTTRPQRFYEVQEGDTLTEIADQFGVPILSIMRLNAIPDQNAIYAGQLIELPEPGDFGHRASVPVANHVRSLGSRPMTSFWPTADHWSVKIPLDTSHARLPQLAERGFVVLRDADFEVPAHEYEALEYMDWKSGGDTNFAPVASADGELDCRGFWDKGKTDKDALWTSNADLVPSVRLSGRGRARTSAGSGSSSSNRSPGKTRSRRSIATTTTASTPSARAGWCGRGSKLTDCPDSYMLLMDTGPDGLPDPASEAQVPLHRARGSSSTPNASGTWWCTQATRPATP